MKLIISIPTYNRPEKLLQAVKVLLPQIVEGSRIEVFDNASDHASSEVLSELQKDFPDRLRIARNAGNVGLGANLTRCIESVDAEWVWVLGDDDAPDENAVANILERIQDADGICMINFASKWSGERTETIRCKTVGELCAHNATLQNLLFISTNIFHRARFLEHLRFAYGFNHSLGGFLAPVLMEVARGSSSVVLEAAGIVKWQEADHGDTWTMLAPTLGLMTLLELPLGLDDREFSALGKLLASHTLNPRAALRASLLDTPDQSAAYKNYLFRQIRARVENRRWTGLKDRLWWAVAGFISHLPLSVNLRLLSVWLGRDRVRKLQGSLFNRI